MKTLIKNFFNEECGATAVEYGLMAGLVAIVIIAALTSIGTSLNGTLTTVSTEISNR